VLCLGLSAAFFNWLDYGNGVPTPSPSPTPRPTGTTLPPPYVGPHTLVPAYALIVQVISIAVGVGLAWMAIVFLEQEFHKEKDTM
jgi:hypothetical protein